MKSINTLFVSVLAGLIILLLSTSAYSLEPADFAKDYQYQGAKISPDGKHIAMAILQDGMRKLAIVSSKDFSAVGGANFGERQEVGNFYWANNERIVMQVWVNEPWKEEPSNYGELFAVNIDGRYGRMIYGYRAGASSVGTKLKKKESTYGWAEIISLYPQEEDEILISSTPMSEGGERIPTVHRLNIYTGKMSGIVAGGPVPYANFIADRQGNVKLAVGTDRNDEKRVYSFIEDENDWREVPTESFGDGYYPLTFDESGKSLLFIDNKDHDLDGIYKLDLDTGKKSLLYRDDKVDITGIEYNLDRSNVYAVRVDPDYPTYVMLDKKSEEGQIFKFLLGTFPGYKLNITSRSKDGNLWMIYASNDRSAGGYYLYNKKTNKFSLLFANMNHLPANSLSESIPIAFKASDGVTVSGYITYPAGIPETQNVPMITLVHGGPMSRDFWTFDRELQMLASQGYAVLRLNFRGSTGYGSKFQAGSKKQWGSRVQQDIIEGTKWVIQQGGISQDKVCIMGSSFGGYSALQSATMAPDLFACVVGIAGVYDLQMMFEEGDIPDLLYGKSYLESQLGTNKQLMREFSPVHNVHKLKAPVLIAHGEKDVRVPIEHAEALRDAMEKHGKKFEWFVKDTETHGFYDETNRTEFFQKVSEFLRKHLK
ncbi:S9 family peptidase [Aliiglaciecola litoralis]|uniref:S9 family peptidase n=1 Tax=Aliiglaciecola litoralis TaxID=582857 RepID=A0ABN1LFL1_9ALTE